MPVKSYLKNSPILVLFMQIWEEILIPTYIIFIVIFFPSEKKKLNNLSKKNTMASKIDRVWFYRRRAIR